MGGYRAACRWRVQRRCGENYRQRPGAAQSARPQNWHRVERTSATRRTRSRRLTVYPPVCGAGERACALPRCGLLGVGRVALFRLVLFLATEHRDGGIVGALFGALALGPRGLSASRRGEDEQARAQLVKRVLEGLDSLRRALDQHRAIARVRGDGRMHRRGCLDRLDLRARQDGGALVGVRLGQPRGQRLCGDVVPADGRALGGRELPRGLGSGGGLVHVLPRGGESVRDSRPRTLRRVLGERVEGGLCIGHRGDGFCVGGDATARRGTGARLDFLQAERLVALVDKRHD